jgi:hypothetical protein
MLTRSDITAITCYGLLFAAVVVWAALWSANPNSSANFGASREAARTPLGIAAVDLADDQPEVRRLTKHMRIP